MPPQLTVSQATDLIKTTLEQRLPSPLRIVGEVSNLKANNHWYFSLKDEQSVLSCVAWATATRKFGFSPRDGDQVIATGHVSHYGPQGRTQLYVSELAAVGAGALELRFRALCDKLRGLGYFDEARKKPLPVFPRRIAVITAATGAAVQDVIKTAAQRCRAIGLLIVDVRVQGDGAAQDIARAIRWVDSHRVQRDIDAILVTRGGGSIEDLWAFNERVVADAVFKCTLPVVAAIGHESDTTIIELVADVRASTPTQAAMRLIPSSRELCLQIDHLVHRLGSVVRRQLERERGQAARLHSDLLQFIKTRIWEQRVRLERFTARLSALQPRAVMARRQARMTVLTDRLHRAAARHLDRHRHQLKLLEGQLAAMDPHGVLRRGYSLTMHRDGSLIRSTNQAHRGEVIMTRLADGSIDSVVAGKNARLNGRSRSPRTGSQMPADQMDLFSPSR